MTVSRALLIVEPDLALGGALDVMARSSSWRSATVPSLLTACLRLRAGPVDAILCDLDAWDLPAHEVVRVVQTQRPMAPLVALTGELLTAPLPTIQQVLGVDALVEKPAGRDEILIAIAQAIGGRHLLRLSSTSASDPRPIWTPNPRTTDLLHRIRASVLDLLERGRPTRRNDACIDQLCEFCVLARQAQRDDDAGLAKAMALEISRIVCGRQELTPETRDSLGRALGLLMSAAGPDAAAIPPTPQPIPIASPGAAPP